MITVETSYLKGPQLSWAVAKALKYEVHITEKSGAPRREVLLKGLSVPFHPWGDWAVGGGIVESHRITILHTNSTPSHWYAILAPSQPTREVYGRRDQSRGEAYIVSPRHGEYGPTPLIAAMRCLVSRLLGPAVEVPEELA